MSHKKSDKLLCREMNCSQLCIITGKEFTPTCRCSSRFKVESTGRVCVEVNDGILTIEIKSESDTTGTSSTGWVWETILVSSVIIFVALFCAVSVPLLYFLRRYRKNKFLKRGKLLHFLTNGDDQGFLGCESLSYDKAQWEISKDLFKMSNLIFPFIQIHKSKMCVHFVVIV